MSFLYSLSDDFVLIIVETQERMPRKISSARARERDAERARFLEEQERVYPKTKKKKIGYPINCIIFLISGLSVTYDFFSDRSSFQSLQ